MDTNNKTTAEIKQMYYDLLDSIRHNLSAKLIDTSEDNPKEIYVTLEHGAMGLSTLQMPTIDRIYQEPSEGIIWVHYEGNEGDVELDDLYMDDIIQIVEALEEE